MNPTVTAHAASDGHVRWEADVGSERSPIEQLTVGEDLYVQREHEDRVELLALDHESGEVRWNRRSKGYLTGRVVPTADAVYLVTPVDDPDGGIVARAERFALDGTREWSRPTSLPVGGHIEGALHADGLFCLQNDRELLGLDPETGEARWRFETDGSRIGVAAEADSLYVSLLNTGTVARLPTG